MAASPEGIIQTPYTYPLRPAGYWPFRLAPADLSFDSWVTDLETVVDAVGLEQFFLYGQSQGGPVAVAYTARHPERVRHLILLGMTPLLSRGGAQSG